MKLYHSFPRSCPSHQDYNRFGLDILKSMIDFGLVLAPELIKFTEEETSSTIQIGQKRICFTDIEQSKIKEHSDIFGRFSIVFNHTTALEMGAMPVFYFPEYEKDAPGLTNLTSTLICRLGELNNLLKALDDVRKAAATGDSSKPFSMTQQETGEVVELNLGSTHRLLDHFNKKLSRLLYSISTNERFGSIILSYS